DLPSAQPVERAAATPRAAKPITLPRCIGERLLGAFRAADRLDDFLRGAGDEVRVRGLRLVLLHALEVLAALRGVRRRTLLAGRARCAAGGGAVLAAGCAAGAAAAGAARR